MNVDRELNDINKLLFCPSNNILIIFWPSMKMFSYLDIQTKVFRSEMFKMFIIYFEIAH